MLTKLDNLLQKIANWKTVLALCVISFPIGYYIGDQLFYKIGQLDYYYSYTADDLYSSISNFYSMRLLEEYLTYQLTYQVFFPFITALFFITFIYHTGNGLVSKKILIPFAFIIPSATLLIDYLENAGLIILIRSSYERPGRIMTLSSFLAELKNTAEITSGLAPIKGFLWDMQSLIFFAGIAIYIFKTIRFALNKTGVFEKFKKNLSYALPISSTNSDGYDKDFENKIKGQTNGIQTKAQELSKVEARSNILALVGVIGLIWLLALIVIFLRRISPYPLY
jgi:hypothetical protein